MSDAQYQGYEAYMRGDLIEMNPYDFCDGQWSEWQRGYYEAGE